MKGCSRIMHFLAELPAHDRKQ